MTSDDTVLLAPPQSVRFDAGRHPRAKIGYVLLATEQTIQDDVMELRPQASVFISRAPRFRIRSPMQTLAAQAGLLADCAATLLPDGSLDVVCYGCTSGSLVIGEERVFANCIEGHASAKPTSLITGVIRALRAVQAQRIVVATPYLDESQPARSGISRAALDSMSISISLD